MTRLPPLLEELQKHLKNLVEHMSKIKVGNENYSSDVMGDSYEYLNIALPVGVVVSMLSHTSPYEEPVNPEIEIDTSQYAIEEATEYVMKRITKYLD